MYAARGVLSVHTERGTSIVPANRVAWTPAGFTHYHRAHSETDMRILFLPPSLARLAPGHPAVFMVSGLAREILLTLTGPRNYDRRPRGAMTAPRSLASAGSSSTNSTKHTSSHCSCQNRATTGCGPSREMLYKQPADNTSLAELGQAIGASGRTLSRLFHDELGMTFYEWRTQLRIYHALVLLADGHDTTHVAHACGWANPSSFIAAFTSIIGTTPGRHRTSEVPRATP